MKDQLLQEIREYLHYASAVAVERQRSAGIRRKEDGTYVTDTDLDLSRRAIECFTPLLGEESVVTEEHPGALGQSHETEYLVVVDPIDGTRNYVHGLPFYAVSVGILKGGIPWIGGVAFPGLGESVWSDGERIHQEGTVLPGAGRHRREDDLFFVNEDFFRRYRWDYRAGSVITLGCSVMELCMPLLGGGAGTLFTGKVWDMAGVWPLVQVVGWSMRGVESGELLTEYRPEWFHGPTGMLREYVVVAEKGTADRVVAGIYAQG